MMDMFELREMVQKSELVKAYKVVISNAEASYSAASFSYCKDIEDAVKHLADELINVHRLSPKKHFVGKIELVECFQCPYHGLYEPDIGCLTCDKIRLDAEAEIREQVYVSSFQRDGEK